MPSSPNTIFTSASSVTCPIDLLIEKEIKGCLRCKLVSVVLKPRAVSLGWPRGLCEVLTKALQTKSEIEVFSNYLLVQIKNICRIGARTKIKEKALLYFEVIYLFKQFYDKFKK